MILIVIRIEIQLKLQKKMKRNQESHLEEKETVRKLKERLMDKAKSNKESQLLHLTSEYRKGLCGITTHNNAIFNNDTLDILNNVSFI